MPESPSIKITASIVTYRSGPVITSCIEHLKASTSQPLEIVVFDNASNDDTLQQLAPFGQQIRVVRNPENLGFGQGHNQALAGARGDYFLILNPDIELPPGGLDRLLEYLEARPECGAVAPLLDEKSSSGPTGFSKKYPGERYAPRSFAALPGECAFLQGACLLIRAGLYRDIGGFDPRYFLYAEDLDLSLEIRKRGFTLAYLTDLQVCHLGGHSEKGRPSSSVAKRKYAGLVLFYRKHYPSYTNFILLTRDGMKFSTRYLGLVLFGQATSEKAAEYKGRLQAWWSALFRLQAPRSPTRVN